MNQTQQRQLRNRNDIVVTKLQKKPRQMHGKAVQCFLAILCFVQTRGGEAS
jgi:hypothetical protein